MPKRQFWKFKVDTSKMTIAELEDLERCMKRFLLSVQIQIALKKRRALKRKNSGK